MSGGVQLASGYISLSVKTDGAMKELVAAITGVEKQAEKSSKAAGDALSKGISKGAKDAGKAVNDEFVSGATKAGESAGKAAGDALEKGVRQGAEKAGKSAGDALDRGIGDAAKQSGKRAGDSIGGSILESVNKAATSAGIDLNKVLVDAAGRAGGAIGRTIGDSSVGHWLQGISDKVAPVVDGLHNIGDAIAGIRDKDAAGTLNGVAGALNSIGQSGAASAVGDLAGKVAPVQQSFLDLKTQIDGSGQLLRALGNDAPGIAGKIGQIGTAASAMAGPLAAAAAAALQIDQALHIDSNTFDPGKHGWAHVLLGKSADWLGLADPSNGLDKHNLPDAPAPTPMPAGPPAPPAVTAPATDYSWLPKRAKGGVTPAGRIYGPGTGSSDSIIGVGADGIPTARVSTGEGVVKKSAMDNGGAAIVAALNGGMKLPGYDDGTNNVGGAPIPMPTIQVPQATIGPAGQLNDFLNTSQGHPYQYATLWDCSGYMSQIYNKITGKQLPRFNTESDLAAYGFVRGSKPGEFNLGIHHGGGGPNSHMAGTLPDGRAVESGGNGVQIGPGAHGAFDPQFEDHWYLPGSGAMSGLGASITGAPDNPADLFAAGDPAGGAQRTQGYIPAGAGGGGQAGTSLWSGAMQMGASAVNQVIDQAASAASTAISAAATAGSFGAGGQAGAAASQFAIGIGTAMAKRGVQYGFQLAGIGGDALAEILLPFGVPRFFQTDPSQFMPQLPGQAAAVTTGEKAQGQQNGLQTPSPSGPVQPGQMPGQQPVGTSAPIATAGTGNYTPAPTPMQGLAGPQPQGPAAPTPQPPVSPAPVQGPQPVQPKPQQAPQQGAQPPLQPTDLAGLLGLARGGVVPEKFDDGGWLMPNGIAINKTNRPEPILNDEQWGNLHAIAAQGMPAPDPKAFRGGDDYSVRIENVTVKDVNEMQREIDSRQRLQRMRYGGRP